MEYILNASQMSDADKNTIENMHIDQPVLMERAALAVLEELLKRGLTDRKMIIVCGPGNNGGDGICLARLLAEREIYADICMPGGREKLNLAEKKELMSLTALREDLIIYDKIPQDKPYGLIVDAMFGTSLNRPLEGAFLQTVKDINERYEEDTFICAVDIPSGINANDGKVMGMAVNADLTVTFAFKKLGTVLYPGAEYCGELVCRDIGITKKSLTKTPPVFALESDDIALPERIRHSNKGTYGKVLLVAGSKNMAGAAVLSANAALKSGCGMARVYTEEGNRIILQETVPEAIVNTYDENPLADLGECMEWCDVIAIGPGISKSEKARKIVGYVLQNSEVPLVIDADALNIIADAPEMLSSAGKDIIITPHVGEMSRLTGLNKRDILDHLLDTALDYAKSYNVVCVLKDARTVIADPDGRACINLNGNSGMATAGSGDVLTGITASLLAQGLDSFRAAYTACAVHGKAGDVAALSLSEAGVMARDIINEIR